MKSFICQERAFSLIFGGSNLAGQKKEFYFPLQMKIWEAAYSDMFLGKEVESLQKSLA